MMAVRIGLGGAVALTLLVALIWIYPTVSGPFSVECGELDPAPCEQAWRQVASDQAERAPAVLPVTGGTDQRGHS